MEENLTKKSVLITGANGFIGLNIVKTFYQDKCNFDISVVVHKNISSELKSFNNIKIIKADVTNENNNIPSFDIVVHCAGLARDIGCDKKFRRLNFDSVKYMSKLAKEKFIYISSTDVYGIKDFSCADENTPYLNYPKNPYPKYKIESEIWLKNNCKKYVIIRPAAVWGKNDLTLEKRVVEFLKNSPFIVYFGKWRGKNRWPKADVETISKTILILAKTDKFDNQAINIIDSKKTTISDYYLEIIQKYFPNKKFKTIYLPLWVGKFIGLISTFISNLFDLNDAIFDPTYYSVHHISSNLDFDNQKMLKILEFKDEFNN